MANKLREELKLISIRAYAAKTLSRGGRKPVSVQYVYKQIKGHQKGRKIPFRYVKIGGSFWIID